MIEQKRKLKLAIIGGHDIREFGGGTKYIMELIKRLDNFDVTVFSRMNKGSKNLRMSLEDISKVYPIGKLELYECPEIPMAEERFILTPSGLRMIAKLSKFDVIYNMDYSALTNILLAYLGKVYGVRVIFGMHDVLTLRESPIKETPVRKGLMKLYKHTRNWAVMLCPNMRVINEDDVQSLKKLGYKGHAYAITDFVNVKIKPDDIKINKEKFVVLFVNALVINHKGIDLLKEVVDNTLKKDSDLEFHIVGSGEQGRSIVENMVKEHPEKVKWLGFVQEEALKEEFQESGVMILTSRFESFGMSLAEAQSYGLPGVAFNVKGPRNIMKEKERGELITPFDTDKFADAIVRYHEKWKKDKDAYLKNKKEISRITMSLFGEDVIMPKLKEMFEG